VVTKVAGLELKLDANPLPAVGTRGDASFRFAIRKPGLDGLNPEAELVADHAEQVHDPLFVDGGVL